MKIVLAVIAMSAAIPLAAQACDTPQSRPQPQASVKKQQSRISEIERALRCTKQADTVSELKRCQLIELESRLEAERDRHAHLKGLRDALKNHKKKDFGNGRPSEKPCRLPPQGTGKLTGPAAPEGMNCGGPAVAED